MWVAVTVTLTFWAAALALFALGETLVGGLMLVPTFGMGATTVYEWNRRMTR